MNTLFELLGLLIEAIEKLIGHGLEKIFSQSSQPAPPQFIPSHKLLKKKAKGFCLNGTHNLTPTHSYRNAMVIGGTGTGKSATVLIPSLFSMKGSFVIHDPSGELYAKTAGQLSRQGYQLHRINFSQPAISAGYNPLSRIQSITEINKTASLIIRTAMGGHNSDAFWNSQATALLSILIQLVKYQKPQFQHLTTVKYMLQTLGAEPETILKLIIQSQNQALQSELKAFLAYDEKVKAGVIATCLSALQLLKDPQIGAVTSFDSLSFAELRRQPTAIFLQNPTADQAYYRVLTSLFLEQLISFMLSRIPGKKEQPIFCLIDEASSLFLPSLSVAVANVRKYRCGILLALQDFNQLIETYGRLEAETIRSNCFAKMYFGGQSLETARALESMLGEIKLKHEDGREEVRPLITRDEIRTLDQKKALLVCGNIQPMILKLRPYYRQRKYRKLSQLPFAQQAAPAPLRNIPILPHLTTSPTPKYGKV
jgi:type IV secretion system protein VirD4